MADISVQFHAVAEEVISFVDESVKEHRLHVVAMRFHPFEVFVVDSAKLREAILDPTVRRLALTIMPPSISGETLSQFLDQNPDALLLDLGRLTEGGLKESWLTARTSNPSALGVWKQVARKLRAITKTGAVAINPKTGASSKLSSHRFTAGAKELENRGVSILPAAGSSLIKFIE